MLIRFKCSQCDTSVKVDSQHAGKKAKCPGCGVALQIPSLAEIESATRHASPQPAPATSTPARQFADDDFGFEVEPPEPSPANENPFLSPTAEYEPGYEDIIAEKRFAGFWVRVVASIIDGLLLTIVYIVFLGLLFGLSAVFAGPELNDAFFVLFQIANIVVSVVPAWLYAAYMESSSNQATLGKMAMRLKVIDLEGRRISFARATGRHFAKILSNFFYIGFIMVAFTERKQGLHDLLAGTYVVQD